jgi:predicted ThiF/HesA family dinucleotide-utilizing enzyme
MRTMADAIRIEDDTPELDSEYLCYECGVNQATHEYCDDCLLTLRGDYVVIAGGDVIHITEEQKRYAYTASAISCALGAGHEAVKLLTGPKATTAPAANNRANSASPD